jgi:hypothetical protein
VSRRRLAVAWILTVVAFGALFVWGLRAWRALDSRGREAALARARLTATLKIKQEEVLRELRSQGLFREMQWSMERTDPAVSLNGLAEQARGTRLKILAIGPLERKETPQFVKSWQTVQVVAPFADFKELVARIEQDRGLMEDLVLEVPREAARPGALDAREVHARFKMTSMEVTGEARRALQRALAINRTGPGAPLLAEAPSALPRPAKTAETVGRDPFAFVAPTAVRPSEKAIVPKRARATSSPSTNVGFSAGGSRESSSTAALPMMIKGIVSMPDGYLAIVNREIVRVGDVVENHRVEQITATTVMLRRPDGTAYLLTLPDPNAQSSDSGQP